MTTTDAIRLTTPAELLSAIPYLLGFVPDRSVVAVGVGERGGSSRLCLTLRADFPSSGDTAGCAGLIAAHLAKAGATAAVYIIYADDMGPDAGTSDRDSVLRAAGFGPLVVELQQSAHRAGVDVWDTLLVSRGVWRSLLCTDPACCPPTGKPLDLASPTTAAVRAVAAGLSALPSREALADTIRPAEPGEIDAVRVEIGVLTARVWSARRGAVSSRRRTTVRMVERLLDEPPRGSVPPRQVARILVGLADTAAMDRCSRWALGPRGDAAISLWSRLVRLSPPPYAAVPASILSFVAWRQGLGALANIAVQRALDDDPDYVFARLMQEILRHGVVPRAFPNTAS